MKPVKKDKVTVRNEITLEKEKLDGKIEKLSSFILGVAFTELSRQQQLAMERQLDGMKIYSVAIRDRIMDITKQEAE